MTSPLVLLVDDDPAIREWVREGLTLSGFRADEAADGEQAVAKARALKPDVMLIDLQIPGLNGWDVMRRLKADPETAHIRFIAMTGFSMDGAARQEARACGCDAFLAKPCLPETIALEIRLVLQTDAQAAADGPPGERD
jgi:CheY-like chemotaxis protein